MPMTLGGWWVMCEEWVRIFLKICF
jgi:hypothetical protein